MILPSTTLDTLYLLFPATLGVIADGSMLLRLGLGIMAASCFKTKSLTQYGFKKNLLYYCKS